MWGVLRHIIVCQRQLPAAIQPVALWLLQDTYRSGPREYIDFNRFRWNVMLPSRLRVNIETESSVLLFGIAEGDTAAYIKEVLYINMVACRKVSPTSPCPGNSSCVDKAQ